MTNNEVRFLRLPQVCLIAGICKSHVFALQREGKFIKGIKLSPRVTVWRSDELAQWLEARTTESRSARATA